jgi:hypothetical protein
VARLEDQPLMGVRYIKGLTHTPYWHCAECNAIKYDHPLFDKWPLKHDVRCSQHVGYRDDG